MPNKGVAPSYKQHSYAYWANFYASPTDLVVSRATGVNPVAPANSRNSLSNLNKDIKQTTMQNGLLNLVKAGPQAWEQAGLKREDLDPKVQSLYDQVKKTEAAAGVDEEDGFLTRVFDILSRPMFAVASAYKQTITEEQKANGSTDINDASYIPIIGTAFWKSLTQGEAMWDGLAGYNKVTWSQILDQAHPEMNDIAKGVLGFGLDVAMDPTSYIGVGAIKKVAGKTIEEGAKIADDIAPTADNLADFFKADSSRPELVRKKIAESFEDQGLHPDRNFFDSLDTMDFTDPEAIKNFLTAGVGAHPGRTKGAATAGLAERAKHVQVIKTFLEATADVMTKHIELGKYDELYEAAVKDGTLIPTGSMIPESVVRTLTYEALTMPEAEVVGRLNTLYSRRGILGSQIASAKKELTGHPRDVLVGRLNAEHKRITDEINKLVTETRIDMSSQSVRDAVKDLVANDPEFVAMDALYKKANSTMLHDSMYWIGADGAKVPMYQIAQTEDELLQWAQGQLAHERFGHSSSKPPTGHAEKYGWQSVNANLDYADPMLAQKMTPQQWIDKHPNPVFRRYQKALKRRSVIESARSKKIADRVLQATDEVNLPETARLKKYREMKDWRNVAGTLVTIYSRERQAARAADAAAHVADEAGDLGGTVKAIKAKEAMGRGSNSTNKAIENARRELQYRMNNGELTLNDLRNFLRENKIVAPDLLNDFETLLPQSSRILHFGDGFKPITVKQMTAGGMDVDRALNNNERVMGLMRAEAQQYAKEMTPKVLELANDLMIRSMTLEARKAFGIRLGFMGNGPVVASFAMPELIDKLVATAYKSNIVAAGIKGFNKALVSSAGMDKELARIRGREAGRTTEFIKINGARIYQKFSPIPPSERLTAFQQLMRTDVKNYTHPQVVDDIRYELGLIAEKFQVGAFAGLREPLSLSEINMWIPTGRKLKSQNKKGWQISGGSVGEGDDPVEWLLNAMRLNNLNDMDPAQLIWDLQVATEKALARKATVENIIQNFGISTGTISKVYDPMAQQLVNKHGYRAHNLGSEQFIFDPETAKQLDKIQELFSSPRLMETFGEYAGSITQAWKRTVTVRNPGFHTRNTFGDVFVSWLDGVQGVHGVQSHRMALRTVRKFRNLVDAEDPMVKAMGQPQMLDAYNQAKAAGQLGESHNAVLFKKNGKDWTIGDVWAAYVNEGLLSGFANTEFGAVFKNPKNIAATGFGQAVGKVDAKVLAFSEAREDVFRLAHFIDIMRKTPIKDMEKAAAEAGARVRKFHFDYSDFTMTEKLMFARVFPFYKWTRKAFPLMVESLFATPGKMTLVPKAANAIGVAGGFGGASPDVVTPEWITSRMLAPIIDRGDATTYAGVALPYDALRAVGSPGESVLGMLHPGLKGILEASMGQKVNGQDFDLKNYLTGLFPQSNMVTKQLGGTGTQEQLASFLTGITFTQNNSKTVQSELIKRKDKAYGSLPPKPAQGSIPNYLSPPG
jgi:hypothetical protein